MRATLTLAGPVSLVDDAGNDRTPPSMKGRGLLALLGTAKDYRASRAKLQDKLWSDRSPEHGNASLRQTLTEIRRVLGPLKEALRTGPGWVDLDPSMIFVKVNAPDDWRPGTLEFAEDLDIRDNEFDDWLMIQRQYFSDRWSRDTQSPRSAAKKPTPQADDRIKLVISPVATGENHLDGLVELAIRDAAQRASDFIPMAIYAGTPDRLGLSDAIEISSRGVAGPEGIVLHVSLLDAVTQLQLWSRTFRNRRKEPASDIREISSELTLGILENVSRFHQERSGAEYLSIADVFSFDEQRLDRADFILAKDEQSFTNLALRAFIRNTKLIERFDKDGLVTLQEATEYATRALDMAPQNATVLGVASIVAIHGAKKELAVDLADRSMRADRDNLIARIGGALSLALRRRYEEAHNIALQSHNNALSALCPAMSATACSVTAMRTGKFDVALCFASIAHGYAPTYRPALRFLGALEFKMGNIAKAEEAFRKLQALEPDFTLELMSCPSYPVDSLRAGELMGVTHSRLI